MGYELIKIGKAQDERVFSALGRLGYPMKKAQNLCDKGRIRSSSGQILAKNDIYSGELFMIDYVCYSRGLKPVFECDDFAVFNKPSGICSHPNGRNSSYNMYDEIWHLYGRDACVAHRLDAGTSGLLLVAKNASSAKELKALFEERKVLKSYLALVRGDLRKANLREFKSTEFFEFSKKVEFLKDFKGFVIDESMRLGGLAGHTKHKMEISDENGAKRAVTLVRVLEFYPNSAEFSNSKYSEIFGAKTLFNDGATMVQCYPLTGRQHQIRLHLFHVKHGILGDPLYGLCQSDIEKILDEKMDENERILKSGANRLMLHANTLNFTFKGQVYNVEF